MATFDGTFRCRIANMVGGQRPVTWTLPEATSQTFEVGDLVYRNAGYVTVCGADPSLILGIAKADGVSGTAGTIMTEVAVITSQTLVMMLVHNTVVGNSDIEATDMGKEYEILLGTGDAAHVWYIDKNTTSANRVRIQKFYDKLGVANGKVLVTFLPANLEVP